MKAFDLLKAEFLKLRYAPILWLIFVVVLFIALIVFSVHFIDSNSVARLGKNPWAKTMLAGKGMFSVFISIPFVVLFIGAANYLEHQSDAWKTLFSMPISRGKIYYTKLLSYLLVLIFTIMVILISLVLVGYILDTKMPEMEFSYYSIPFTNVLSGFARSFWALLGVIGVQYYLSLRFKGFLIPTGFGVVAFILGIILGSTNNGMALYFPYSYPAISQNFNMFITDEIGIVEHGFFNNVELYSFIYFLFFVLLGQLLITRRRV